MPANNSCPAGLFAGIWNKSYPVFTAANALPQRAQQNVASIATTTGRANNEWSRMEIPSKTRITPSFGNTLPSVQYANS
jgi:hypothetical protein